MVRLRLSVGLQAQRKDCTSCSDCPGFQIWFRASDANDPGVMLHCSVCGCSAHLHEVDQVRHITANQSACTVIVSKSDLQAFRYHQH